MALEFASRKETFPNYRKFETTFAGRPFVVETGKMCGLSNGSAMIRYGETCVLCNVTMSEKPREGIDFFPLSVEFEEKLYAAGRIPGSFMRREGRPGEHAILNSRVVDRPIRPLFPKEMRNDVCVTMTVMSLDPDNSPEIAGMNGASLAIAMSDIPWRGPIGGVQVGLVDGEIVLNPTLEQREKSDLALTLAQQGKRVLLIDCDLRKAALSAFVGNPANGLCDYLNGTAASIGQLVRHYTQCPGLDILPVGTLPANPSELLSSELLGQMLAEACSLYDHILLDCQPLGKVADAALVAPLAKVTLVVVRAGLTLRSALPEIEKLCGNKQQGGIAVVVNDTPQDNAPFFEKGVAILAKLTQGKVYVCCREDSVVETPYSETFVVKGPHPAGNAGVQIANIKPVNKGEIVWTLDADTVVRIGHLFTKGFVDFSCVTAVTGECVKSPVSFNAVAGMPLEALLEDNLTLPSEKCRIISGNVLTGVKENIDGYLHFPFRQVTVIPENSHESEFMGWASLSPKKYSFSHCFFSWLEGKAKKYHFDAKINGSERSIIMAGEYDKVLPMDIYSEYLIKAILAKDIDKMEQLGIYEVAPEDFALCEFIDTSKLELQKIVREGLDYLRKEMN